MAVGFPRRRDRATPGRWAAALIGAGALLVAATSLRTSVTADEPLFYDYGTRILETGSFARIEWNDDSKLPVSALHALPAWAGRRLGVEGAAAARILGRLLPAAEVEHLVAHGGIYAGRFVNLLWYVLLCGLVYRWGREIYGPRGALGATGLVAFLPTVLGHAGVMTVDVAAAATVLAAVYALARCLLDPTVQGALLAGVAIGAALLTKYTAVALLPLSVLLVLVRVATAERAERRGRVGHGAAVATLIAWGVAVLAVNAGFAFERSGTALAELACHSRACQGLRGWLGGVALPLPFEYLNGLDLVAAHDQDRSAGGLVYLLGERRATGFATYYLWAALLKTPLPFLLVLLARRWRRERRFSDGVLLLPVLWYFVHLSLFFHTQIGIRYLLPAFPFLGLLAAGAWDHGRSRRWQALATLLLALQVVTAAATWPRYLSYFNRLIGPRANAFRYLVDSNLDWGQEQFVLWAWQRRHEGTAYAIDPERPPAAGLVIVRANAFAGIRDPDAFDWLRRQWAAGRAQWLGTIGDSYLLFRLSPPEAETAPAPSARGAGPPAPPSAGAE